MKLKLGSCSVWRSKEHEPSQTHTELGSARGAACGACSVWALNRQDTKCAPVSELTGEVEGALYIHFHPLGDVVLREVREICDWCQQPAPGRFWRELFLHVLLGTVRKERRIGQCFIDQLGKQYKFALIHTDDFKLEMYVVKRVSYNRPKHFLMQ